MKAKRSALILLPIILVLFPTNFVWEASAWAQVQYVDLSIGSVGHLLDPTRPLVGLPDGLVRFSPIRRDGLDDQIRCFPLTTITYPFSGLFGLMPKNSPKD